jgi:sortase A
MTNDVIVQGVDDDDLRQGPGHYPGTPLPGQAGNAAIAGHRTTYAAPFYNLNELQVGDPIVVTTSQGTFHYAVTQSEVVSPTDATVLDDTTTPELTLTTCNPRYSSSQRLVVVALLQSSQLALPVVQASPATPPRPHAGSRAAAGSLAGNGGDNGNPGPAVLWGILTAGAALAVILGFRRLRQPFFRRGFLLIGTLAVLAALFVFFGQVSVLLPASF